MKAAALILRKDLLVLRRSPLLLGLLVAYPLVIAALLGLVAAYASSTPRVAFVDRDGLPAAIEIGGRTFHIDRTIDRVSENVTLVRMSEEEAERELATGKVVAVVTVPPGFVSTLRAMVRSPQLELRTTRGGLSSRVRQQMQALVYNLNLRLQRAFIAADLEYVRLLLHGGKGRVLGQEFDVLGLDGVARLLQELPRGPRLDAIREFVDDARKALALTDDAIRATANPIRLEEAPSRGRSWVLSAQVQAYAIAVTISFLALLLAAGALAAERDENVVGRLARGLVGRGQLVLAKVALAGAVSVALGIGIALTFGVAIEAAGVAGGEPWERVPLLVCGIALAGASLGALGALIGGLAREARAASLVAILFVLPVVFVGLVPREIVPPAGWISDAFPFVHAVRFFSSALYDASPWGTLAREALWLGALGGAFAVAARSAARRLSA